MSLAIHSWPDGTKYEGYWKDDLQHDKGIEVKVDGSSYNGEFKMGKKHGHGVQQKWNKLFIIINSWIYFLLIFNFNV